MAIRAALIALLALLAMGCASGESGTGQLPTDAQSEQGSSATEERPSTIPTTVAPTSTTVAPTTTTVAPTTTTVSPTPAALDCLALLPESTKLGQVLMPLAVESELADLESLAAWRLVGGTTLLGNPGAGLAESLTRVQEAAGDLPLLLASDEEGGAVQRLGSLLGDLPAASTVAATLTTEQASALAEDYGTQMADLGLNMVLAPVVDVGAGPGIGTRAFSEFPQIVIEYARAVADGYLAAGIIPVLKHFPGHGRASADSHATLPITPGIDQVRSVDLEPYRALLDLEGIAVMVGHLDVPGLTDGVPASLSPAATGGLLRAELGFDGLVLSDSLAMGALAAYSQAEAARLALTAGADMVIVASPSAVPGLIEELQGFIAAGSLSWETVDRSVARILDAKGLDPCAM